MIIMPPRFLSSHLPQKIVSLWILVCFILLWSLGSSLASSLASMPSKQSIYLVLLKGPPVLHLFDDQSKFTRAPAPTLHENRLYMPGQYSSEDYAAYLISTHDSLLRRSFTRGSYQKLYSYHHILNGFAVVMTPKQAAFLEGMPEVAMVQKDYGVKKQTTHTPRYLGLPTGAWEQDGGAINAGEGIVIGLVDTGIDPTHPSFSDDTLKPYPNVTRYIGFCEETSDFPNGSCNKKLVGARHFADAAIASGRFNPSRDFASPLDADGHGTHTASTAAGNNGVPVIVDGLNFGFASGMAPRAHVAMYKALYRDIGGLLADVLAAIEQAVKDKVDILSLSIGQSGLPSGIATYFNVFDIGLLSAAKAGVFIAHAAGNAGPSAQSMLSFSPWLCTVAASVHDRTYPNAMLLGNNATIEGLALASGTSGNGMYTLVLANDALSKGSSAIPNFDECQNASLFQKPIVQGRVLICTYSLNFVFGASTVGNVIDTVKNLSAAGVVLVLSPGLEDEFTIPLAPFSVPAIIVSTTTDSVALSQYYQSAPNFTATARILGGEIAMFSHEAPRVASFSSRGPDSANSNLQEADLLKPNVMAPGNLIWAAWSTIGADSPNFQGQNFAMISGTSMATPHIAGIAALIKQKNPNLSPAAIASALGTTAFVTDKNGDPLLAQHPSSNTTAALGPATPFDFGSGAVNATAALDPGLVFDTEFEGYIKFLCAIPGAASTVKNTTGMTCDSSWTGLASDLNMPSITIANLTAARSVPRTVTSVAAASETYAVQISEPSGVSVKVDPMQFTIASGNSQELKVSLVPSATSQNPSFGSLVLMGSNGHKALVPISVIFKTISPASILPYC